MIAPLVHLRIQSLSLLAAPKSDCKTAILKAIEMSFVARPITAEELVEKIRYGRRLEFESKGMRKLKIAAKPFSADGALRWLSIR